MATPATVDASPAIRSASGLLPGGVGFCITYCTGGASVRVGQEDFPRGCVAVQIAVGTENCDGPFGDGRKKVQGEIALDPVLKLHQRDLVVNKIFVIVIDAKVKLFNRRRCFFLCCHLDHFPAETEPAGGVRTFRTEIVLELVRREETAGPEGGDTADTGTGDRRKDVDIMAAFRQHETAGVGAFPVPTAHITRPVHNTKTF